MGTAIKHPVTDQVKPSFVIFDIRALWRSGLSVRVPGCQNYKWRLNTVWYWMPYSWTHASKSVGVKGLKTTSHLHQPFKTVSHIVDIDVVGSKRSVRLRQLAVHRVTWTPAELTANKLIVRLLANVHTTSCHALLVRRRRYNSNTINQSTNHEMLKAT